MKQTTIRLDEKDQTAIAAIREYYGISSDIDAIRIALRELQRRIASEVPPPIGVYPEWNEGPRKERGLPPHG